MNCGRAFAQLAVLAGSPWLAPVLHTTVADAVLDAAPDSLVPTLGDDLVEEPLARNGDSVALAELHENRRIDLQLAGSCGRQGDPDEVNVVLSLEDGLFSSEPARVPHPCWDRLPPQCRAACLAMRALQHRQTRRTEAARRCLQKYGLGRERSVALSGALE